MSLSLRRMWVSGSGGVGGGGSVREGAGAGTGEESKTMGSELEVPGVVECILILEGRLMGESAVVRRRLRSELREDAESVREGRFGRVYRDEDEDEACVCGCA